ncbi:MAG TPA: hypothetical protein VEQ11_06360 [Chloroflexota bacterium]|nr:hypothetical protein [Chloroflexota bacterium]
MVTGVVLKLEDNFKTDVIVALALTLALVLGACARAADRPREGAEPVAAGSPASRLLSEPPTTLVPPPSLLGTPTPEPSSDPPPTPIPSSGPRASPGIYPIISSIQPPPGAELQSGEIAIGARVTGSSNLVDVVAFVDGEPFEPSLGSPAGRSLVISFNRQLSPGTHEVRVQARDEQGQMGGYRWQFTVGPRQAPSVPTRVPVPTFAPAATLAPPTPRGPTQRLAPAPSPAPKPGSR